MYLICLHENLFLKIGRCSAWDTDMNVNFWFGGHLLHMFSVNFAAKGQIVILMIQSFFQFSTPLSVHYRICVTQPQPHYISSDFIVLFVFLGRNQSGLQKAISTANTTGAASLKIVFSMSSVLFGEGPIGIQTPEAL